MNHKHLPSLVLVTILALTWVATTVHAAEAAHDIVVYGGTIRPGYLGDKKLDIVSAFEAYGQWLAKQITEEELKEKSKF